MTKYQGVLHQVGRHQSVDDTGRVVFINLWFKELLEECKNLGAHINRVYCKAFNETDTEVTPDPMLLADQIVCTVCIRDDSGVDRVFIPVYYGFEAEGFKRVDFIKDTVAAYYNDIIPTVAELNLDKTPLALTKEYL